MTSRTYTSPAAFKQALEQRLKQRPDLARQRQLLIFDRFLARVAGVLGEAVILKGGLALELRLQHARTTRDVDLRVAGSPDQVLKSLRDAGRLDLGDFLTFAVARDTRSSVIQNDGTRYEGIRFRAECRLAGKIYGSPFGVDVAFGDPIYGEPQSLRAKDVLYFAGIQSPTLRVYPVESHLAEKLHAYTMPRPHPNSRVKDLPDIALLATAGPLSAGDLATALDQTFNFRSTHLLPTELPQPPELWVAPYAAMARKNQLP
ncbi:nucleotidyl transferase AbiEii/AbiGii toxin family protein [Lujinxingia vulgaris]|uniref:Nucleotidyl transferase AbiEii/AbiGii toxin family protein n=1 Tax=Lujinxingia vulgaris TaxID=2600176 RepID=A0A5C6XGE8_9DELT|nr:nucleotidyl transferase AbiEii/AbiGii toxin family protein [Lujinxingia vulgaris]TXD37969.1 nucleotidyl transferase AbiEii/AbiGii toxin family protein [Lujinxingia vulgaris]